MDSSEIPHWYPDLEFIRGYRYKRDALWNYGVDRLADLYTRRNLWALSAFVSAIHRETSGEALLLVLTASCMWLSRMNRHRPNSSFKTGIINGTYCVPQIKQDQSVFGSLPGKFKTILRSETALWEALAERIGIAEVSTEPWQMFDMRGSEACVDYIFTDPAYVHKIQYGELNFVWESWLGFTGESLKDEIVVNSFRKKSIDDWDHDMRAALGKCYRVLKPGRWLSLCYHDTDPGTWRRVQDMLLDNGFEIHTVTVLDPKQKSNNQNTGEKVVKSDLVLNCRKPKSDDPATGGHDGSTGSVSRRVREIVVETLSQTGGQTRDSLWDVVLKRLLTRGQMAEHRFEEILAEVAFKSESGRWFLKEEFESLSQNDIRNEEDAGVALERFARLRSMGVPAEFAAHLALYKAGLAGPNASDDEVEDYIKEHVIDDPAAARKFRLSGRLKGIEFYDCLFFYLTRFLKGRPAGKTPRRNLAEFLEEYLVRSKDGDKWLYRAPDRAEAESLRKSRQTGLGRRIRQFVAFLRGEGEFPQEKMPDARTLVAWLKHCSAFGLADEGVAIYERGGLMAQLYSLSEDERYDADEYYTNCKRKATKTRDDEDEEGVSAEDDEGNREE